MSADILNAQHNDDTFENIWQELKWRGLVHVSTDEEALEKALSDEKLTFYTGYDPTAASLHLGHLVQLLVMRRLQLAGHYPLGLVGGFTGLIGDPRQTSERVLNSREVVAEWVQSLRSQIERFLSFEGENAARMVNNLDWGGQLSAIDFLRDIGKHFRVGTMVKKEIVAKRLNSEEGISYTEFSYQILQGLDYLELNRQYGCTLQTGGSDQWGNLTSGTELIRKVYKEYGDRFAIAGIGGVFTPEQAYAKIRSGSSLVMFISSLMYRGPQQITVLKRGLAQLLRRDGFEHVSDAVGVDVE